VTIRQIPHVELPDELIPDRSRILTARQWNYTRTFDTRTFDRTLPAPYERSKVTCEWLAGLFHQKFSLLAPLDRITRHDLAGRGRCDRDEHSR
jgi:hypothetical protein